VSHAFVSPTAISSYPKKTPDLTTMNNSVTVSNHAIPAPNEASTASTSSATLHLQPNVLPRSNALAITISTHPAQIAIQVPSKTNPTTNTHTSTVNFLLHHSRPSNPPSCLNNLTQVDYSNNSSNNSRSVMGDK
jgi:hypothetical protein